MDEHAFGKQVPPHAASSRATIAFDGVVILPANAGFSAMTLVIDATGALVDVCDTPIIGWRLAENAAAVSAIPLDPSARVDAIAYPDGRVQTQSGRYFECIDAWFASSRRRP